VFFINFIVLHILEQKNLLLTFLDMLKKNIALQMRGKRAIQMLKCESKQTSREKNKRTAIFYFASQRLLTNQTK